MTNGTGHHESAAKKKAAKKPKAKDSRATLKKKNMLPDGLAKEKKDRQR